MNSMLVYAGLADGPAIKLF